MDLRTDASCGQQQVSSIKRHERRCQHEPAGARMA
jgi:hypothetical protein